MPKLGQAAEQMRFQELKFDTAFDGIWTCASLLHVSGAELPGVLGRFRRALKIGGVWFLSFKLGRGEEHRSERLFNQQDEETLGVLLEKLDGVSVIEMWRSHDLRPGREEEMWLNSVVRRTA